MVDDLFEDAALRTAFETGLGFSARNWGASGWAFERSRMGLRRVEAGPVGLYACLCSSTTAAEGLQAQMAVVRRSWRTRARINLNPLEAHATTLAERAHALGFGVITGQTHLLQLSPSMADTRRRYHATKRSQVTRAVALDSVILRAATAQHLDDYFGAYAASLVRWGRAQPPYPRTMFDALLASPSTRIWMHYVAGRLACAMVVLVCRPYALYWQGVSQIEPDQKAAFPMARLMDAVLLDLTNAGVPWMNLGASDGLPNVRRFKEEFGGQPRACLSFVHEPAVWRAWNAARRWR